MQLINCKVALKLEWANHYVLSAVGADNDHANSNNIIFTIKEIKLYLPVVTSSAKDNQEPSNLFSKEFEISVYWNEFKTKSENKNTTIKYSNFLQSKFLGVNRLFVSIYSNRDDNAKSFKLLRYYLRKGIIIINGKNHHILISFDLIRQK